MGQIRSAHICSHLLIHICAFIPYSLYLTRALGQLVYTCGCGGLAYWRRPYTMLHPVWAKQIGLLRDMLCVSW